MLYRRTTEQATPLSQHDIRGTALKSLRESGAFVANRKAIVAVSGGADSVALLHILLALRAETGLALHVASLDHGLRGEDGRRDLAFVSDLARGWGLPFSPGAADIKSLARQWGMGLEEAARRARYDFLAEVARQAGSRCVLTGHHALDQAETILLHIARGSGAGSLRGMQAAANLPGHSDIRLLRPLLQVPQGQLLAYCAQHGLPSRHDKSNDDIAYSRNYLRHEVIPRLRRLNPKLEGAFTRLADTAATEDHFIAQQFAALVMPKVTQSARRWRISKAEFSALHPALQRRLLREAYSALADGSAALSYDATVTTIAKALKAETGARLQLGNGLRMRISYEDLYIEDCAAAPDAARYRLIPAATDINLTGRTSLNYCGLSINLRPGGGAAEGVAQCTLPAAMELRLRTRRAGDRFMPKGMAGRSLKLKDWMIDRKIPRELRAGIPLISADGKIIAICVADTWHLAEASLFTSDSGDWVTLSLG